MIQQRGAQGAQRRARDDLQPVPSIQAFMSTICFQMPCKYAGKYEGSRPHTSSESAYTKRIYREYSTQMSNDDFESDHEEASPRPQLENMPKANDCSPEAYGTQINNDSGDSGEAAQTSMQQLEGDDEFGDFGEADQTTMQPLEGDDEFGDFGEADQTILKPEEDDEFGDFGEADQAAMQPEDVYEAAPKPLPASLPPATSDPDLLSLSDDDFLTAAAAAWPRHLTGPAAFPSAPEADRHRMPHDALSRLRAMRMTPYGVDPDSVLAHGGLPLAQVSPAAVSAWLSSSPTPLERSRAATQLLGQVYTPSVR